MATTRSFLPRAPLLLGTLLIGTLLLARSVSAAVLPFGAGSVADGVNPASYGCVIDYGNWITNAGVVQPGIAGCDPKGDYNGIPYGTPTKLYPQLVDQAATVPTATHRWWGMVPFYGEGQAGGSGAGYLTADPLMARATNRGVRVMGLPNGLRTMGANQFVYSIPDPSREVFDGIAIGNAQFSTLNAYMQDHSDGSITVQWRSGATPVMTATLVHGSPYMFFEVFAGTPVIRTKAPDGGEKGIFHQAANSLGVWTNVAGVRNHFLVIGEGDMAFSTPQAAEIAFNPPGRRFTLAWLPVTGTGAPGSAMMAEFSQYALNRIARVTIDHAVDPQTQAVTVSHAYLGAGGERVTTLAGLMPLQWKNTSHALGTYKTRSARGVVRFTPTSGFDYRLPFVGVLPLLPNQLSEQEESRLRALVTAFVNEGAAAWNPKTDTYWSGKAYGKVAEVAALAGSLGMTAEAATLVGWLKSELADWFSATTTGPLDKTKYFAYDRDWNTLLGFEESFGAQQQLNDHHFHYGYFVRAAAEVCRVDASWCSSQAYGPMIELLIRGYAAGRDDPLFPYLRHFDPANGFSWASGHANFALGNNNESTSEAANAYGAIVLYGLITGNQELVDRGVYLHASTTAAYWEYWNNLDAFRGLGSDFDNFPPGYDKIATSIIWGAGGVFSTWFSGAYAHILGIQGLPLNPLVLHIGQHADYLRDYVTLGLSQSSNGQPSGLPPGQWTDIWWNILAMTDPQRAIDDFNALNLNYTVEEGETRAHTFQWIHAFRALGHVESGKGTITADYPAAVAFNKNGVITYVVYNLGSGTRHVRFSDGMSINAPAGSFGIKRTGDVPDPADNGDTQPPTQPGAPSASSVTVSSAVLAWTSSTDNTAVAGYEVTVDGRKSTTATPGIEISGLAPDTQYLASVVAFDAAGNRSGASSGFFVTAADTQAPTTPGAAVASNITFSGATLNWTAATDNVGVAGYEVTVAGNTLGTTATTLVVDNLTAATLVTVSVRAFDAAGNRSSASTASFTTPAAPCTANCEGDLPAGWTSQDVGSPKPGSARFAGGVFTTTANGTDIWATQDSFHFVHRMLTGDGRVTARVTALDLTDAWAKAGVMMRGSLAANSQHVFMAVTGSNGAAFQRRTATGGASSHTGGSNVRAPHWVRLERQGNLFTGLVSADGSTWSIVGSQVIGMPGTVYVGLAHTSHRSGVLGNAGFAGVQVTGGAADTQAPTAPGVAVASNVTASGATLNWAAASDNVAVTGYEVTVGGNTLSTTATTLVVGDLTAETMYAVSVRAFDAAGNRSSASTAGFTTLPATCTANCDGDLPAEWTAQDVGSTAPGATRIANGIFVTTASGADIWGSTDSFHFVHRPLIGDGQVTARVTALDPTDAWAKAGVMMRASLAGNSQHALMAVTAGNGAAFQRRTAAAGASSHTAGPSVRTPHWVRLVRTGNLFTGYVSGDGTSWVAVGSQTIAMPGTVYAGLAHTSHREGVLGQASFASVSVSASAPPGAVLIQAEDYTAYADSDTANNGRAYRGDSVDIEATSDVNGGFNVGWTKLGEWLEFTTNLVAGNYRICSRVASSVGGGAFTLKLDGQTVAAQTVANTGGWQRWVTLESPVFAASAGTQTLRLDIQSGDFNVNWFEITTEACSVR
jgi:chitodextrinase/regulation of enolase protein 1 (concanavalin A-like superfamily)